MPLDLLTHRIDSYQIFRNELVYIKWGMKLAILILSLSANDISSILYKFQLNESKTTNR